MGYLLLHTGQPTAKRLLRRIPQLAGVENINDVKSNDRVIRWGNVSGSDREAEFVLNPRASIVRTRSRLEMLSILHQNGIRCPYSVESGKERLISLSRHYRVPVFNMRAISIYKSDGKLIWLDRRITRVNDQFREVPLDEDRVATRVARLAVRAVHALGLDFGLVSLGISTKGFAYVLDVSPAPILKDNLLDTFSNAIRNWIEEEDQIDPPSFKMGTDLEFMLRNREGKMVVASNYLPRNGKVGCDALSIRREGRKLPLAEIRPAPSSSPIRLVKNIEDTLLEAKRLIPRNVQWVAGSMPFRNFGIGGHIHYSNLPLSSQLVKALDNYLALPVMLIEDPATAVRRRPKYGFLGDIRLKSHGGWEYRTLGSWMISPAISTAILCLAHLAATHYRELNRTPLSNPELQRAFYNGDKKTLRPYFEEIWQDIEDTSMYETYEEYLDIISTMVRNGETWNELSDIKRAWGIQYSKSLRTGRSSRT
ncbi:putative amidoligase domain-containing protein [Effusibacillus consociatus]|uniref:Phage phiEco32-like COOH-NH2 ligase-type 2 n=1 Tax=Effusibacillus consociatus TaxID=1117041 RepID=A0ABV9Q170_9BACL